MRILIKENSPDIRGLYSAMLSPWPSNITFTAAFDETEEIINDSKSSFNAIFLELRGLEQEELHIVNNLCEEFLKKHPSGLLVLVPSYPIHQDTFTSYHFLKQAQVLAKPFNVILFHELIDRLSNTSNSLQPKRSQLRTYSPVECTPPDYAVA